MHGVAALSIRSPRDHAKFAERLERLEKNARTV